MLFNSTAFLLGFLPLTFAIYLALGRYGGRRMQIAWLLVASLFFYGWWNPKYLVLLGGSIVGNFALAHVMSLSHGRLRRVFLAVLILSNLLPLFFYKYFDFAAGIAATVTGATPWVVAVGFPLGISFFTFQQIAYVIDVYRGERESPDFLRYALFVTFFPHLIAGPIVHHQQMIPQFRYDRRPGLRFGDIAVGASLFAIGGVKKVFIADTLASYVDPVFGAASAGAPLPFLAAWSAFLACGLQIYFDFSGYSDMAIGLGRLFGVRLPINFNSPFKARNIIEFWQRWHITMTRFFVDYLYNPLALSLTRRALARELYPVPAFALSILLPTLVTCVTIGLWHGAGWNFLAFGAMHGVMLSAVHAGRMVGLPRLPRPLACAVTLFLVFVTFVYFRAADIASAHRMFAAMAGRDLAQIGWIPPLISPRRGLAVAGAALLICLVLPNSIQFMRRYAPVIDVRAGWQKPLPLRWLVWRPLLLWAVPTALVVLVVALSTSAREFIYFKF